MRMRLKQCEKMTKIPALTVRLNSFATRMNNIYTHTLQCGYWYVAMGPNSIEYLQNKSIDVKKTTTMMTMATMIEDLALQ